MSMHSIRDLSIIATPPAKRLSVKTFIRKKETRVTKEAILREILRGGQVYYLHNDVKTIQRAADVDKQPQMEHPITLVRMAYGLE